MELISRDICTGCMACVNACNKECIDIILDDYGNEYPKINNTLCVSCGNCRKACPKINSVSFYKPSNAYACWSLSNQIRSISASGGVAAEFYRYAINYGYYICGSKYFDSYRVGHYITNDSNEIQKFQSSKYVFSQTKNVYKEIKSILDTGGKVLFISLPCKVAGLISYLGRKYDNLVTIDIVCHGVPPYKQLREHIDHVDLNRESNILKFRKDNQFVFQLLNDNREVYSRTGRIDSYLAAFLEGINYRESCYTCEYACNNRVGDITIGDFWGLGIDKPFNHPYTGSISVVIINTEKGRSFFNEASENLFVEEREVEEAVKWNAQLQHPTYRHKLRDEFLQSVSNTNFDVSANAVLYRIIQKAKRDKKFELFYKTKNRIRRIVKGNKS